MTSPLSWPDALHAEFGLLGVRQVAYVPDAGHRRLIELCEQDPAIHAVSLTTEEEGVALLAGAWLGGQRGVLLLQSSGVGNCINMLSLQQECRMPLVMLVTMRGEWSEFNPWQVAMGSATERVLAACGVQVYRIDRVEDVVETVRSAGLHAWQTGRSVAVLISQRLLGAKSFRK